MSTVYTEHTGGGGLQSIPLSFLMLLSPAQPDSQALMMKIKEHHTLWLLICCASVLFDVLHDSWFSEFTLSCLCLHLYSLSSTLPCVQHHFTPPSPNLFRPLPVPGQVSAYKFENDLSCPLNNRWESRVWVPSINSIRALISEQKGKKNIGSAEDSGFGSVLVIKNETTKRRRGEGSIFNGQAVWCWVPV